MRDRSMLDLRQLRYFVAVAEAEHVGRAAELLHISPSPLSRQIIALEEQLGLALFERSKKRVHLTREGQIFLGRAHDVLAHAQQIEAEAQRLGRGDGGSLRVGYVEAAVHADVLADFMRRLRSGHRNIRIELRNLRSGAQADRLRRRDLDIGFVYTAPPDDDADLVSTLLLEDQLLLAVPADDPAFVQRAQPGDLDGRAWIARPRADNPVARERFLAACRKAGFTPDIRYEAGDLMTALGLVQAGLGLTLLHRRTVPLLPQGVRCLEVPWLPLSLQVHAVWRRDDPGASVKAAVGVLAEDQPSSRGDRDDAEAGRHPGEFDKAELGPVAPSHHDKAVKL